MPDRARRTLRVLLAEDNVVNQEVAAAILRKRGHNVQIVSNGREAVDAVRGGPVFDVVLMDVQMPELDGIAATKEIREFDGTATPIVALTANASSADRQRSLDAGMNTFLSKPFKARDLFVLVESFAKRSPVAAPRATPVQAPAPAPVDLVSFRAMLADAGIEEAGAQMLDLFLTDAPKRLLALQVATRDGDSRGVEQAAHAFKSGAANIRAQALTELLTRAELAGRGAELATARVLADAIAIEFRTVADFLNEHTDNASTPR
jgi:CheY-like chemotaxis protein